MTVQVKYLKLCSAPKQWYDVPKGKHVIPKNKNRPIHKRIALHPASFVALLALGVCLVVTTFRSQADTLDVSAKIAAPPVTQPAIIMSPHDQDRFTTPDILVSGTCPNDSYVKLYQNDVFVGVSQCTANSFSVTTTLSPGANVLKARVFNITDDEGPQSPSITVFYDAPVPPPITPPTGNQPTGPPIATAPGSSAAGNGVSSNGRGMAIIGDYHYQAHYQGDVWQWPLSLSGGVAPYLITVDWGDGTAAKLTRPDANAFTITHTYNNAGLYQPIVRASDSSGLGASLQLSAVVKPKPLILSYTQNPFLQGLQKYLWAAWPAYAVVVLMVVSFWLGEREILQRQRSNRRGSRV